jgi:hypothetical protein
LVHAQKHVDKRLVAHDVNGSTTATKGRRLSPIMAEFHVPVAKAAAGAQPCSISTDRDFARLKIVRHDDRHGCSNRAERFATESVGAIARAERKCQAMPQRRPMRIGSLPHLATVAVNEPVKVCSMCARRTTLSFQHEEHSL